MSLRHLNRRSFLSTAGAAGLLPAGALLRPTRAAAAPVWTRAMPGVAVDFDAVDKKAAELAATPFESNAPALPDALAKLIPEQYHAIGFRPEATLWRDETLPFQVQFFPRGSYFRHAVAINVIDGEELQSHPYREDFFDFSGAGLPESPPADLGFAGFRLMYPLNRNDRFDELAVFLGASYFRVLAAGQHYGLSARALAVDTGLPKKEEFPFFREFWLTKPQSGAGSIDILALLDSVSLTGAYHFRLTPGRETTMEIRARVYTRGAVEKLGIAPLTSMFLYGENSPPRADDLRPEVHDSDGMMIVTGPGERIWRPLTNRDSLQVSAFADHNPRAFGLLQRDRDSRHYLDLDFNYQRRPSAWIEPLAPWGKGAVQLIEIPSDSERYDNIGLFWVPERAVEAGQVWPFAYRLCFGSSFESQPASGRTLSTREGADPSGELRRFAVEFGGAPLEDLSDDEAVELVVTATAGEVQAAHCRRDSDTRTWFAFFDLNPGEETSIELRAFLKAQGHSLTETWSYLWKRS